MKLEDIRANYEKRPFRSFIIRIKDGEQVIVDHPELMVVGDEDELVIVYRPGEGVRVIDADAITQLHITPAAKPRRRTA